MRISQKNADTIEGLLYIIAILTILAWFAMRFAPEPKHHEDPLQQVAANHGIWRKV